MSTNFVNIFFKNIIISNILIALCVNSSVFADNQKNKKSHKMNLVNKSEKSTAKKIVESKAFKIGAAIVLSIGASVVAYEIILNLSYKKNKSKLDVEESEVKKMSPKEKIFKFLDLLSNFEKKYSGSTAIFYSIMDVILFRNAKEMQCANAKRMIAFNRGVCRNIATLVSYWLDKLEIPNHIAVCKFDSNRAHVFNVYYNCIFDKWMFMDLTKAHLDVPYDDFLIRDGRVIESSQNWGKKSQTNLMTASCKEFISNPLNCKYDEKLGDYLNLSSQLLTFYK